MGSTATRLKPLDIYFKYYFLIISLAATFVLITWERYFEVIHTSYTLILYRTTATVFVRYIYNYIINEFFKNCKLAKLFQSFERFHFSFLNLIIETKKKKRKPFNWVQMQAFCNLQAICCKVLLNFVLFNAVWILL